MNRYEVKWLIKKNLPHQIVSSQIRCVHSEIKTPTDLIVKTAQESYKSKKFSKLKWDCIINDVLKNKEAFSVKEIVEVITILSHFHFGKEILPKLKPTICKKLRENSIEDCSRIMIAYLRTHEEDGSFFSNLYDKIKNGLSVVSLNRLINLSYHISINYHKHTSVFSVIQRQILCEVLSKLNDQEKKRNENTQTDIKCNRMNESEINKNGSSIAIITLGNYAEILLFYSISVYLLTNPMSKENDTKQSAQINQLLSLYKFIERNLILKKEKIHEQVIPFHLFLLYKACLNYTYYSCSNITVQEEKEINQHSKTVKTKSEELSYGLYYYLNDLFEKDLKTEFKKKGRINEIIRYIYILKQNVILYAKNKKNSFHVFFGHNISLIKKALTILQEHNKNNINKYYTWHREQVEETQMVLQMILDLQKK